MITLYHGGMYHLYRYKKYTDVRLVFAPEDDIAAFGGDPDNFEYPRFDLDICFFRVYENGQPVQAPHYLKWNPASLKEDDLVFVAGQSGPHGADWITVRHLEFLRDVQLPSQLSCCGGRTCWRRRSAGRSAENARRAREMCWGSRTPARPAWAAWPASRTPP